MNLEEIEKVIDEKLGAELIPLVRALHKKQDFSEFKIAEEIDKTINEARSLLYKLNNAGLATFIKKKDEKKGWYICYWTLQMDNLTKTRADLKDEKLKTLKEKLKKENEGQFYMCKDMCMRVHFDNAFSLEFKCPECGSSMERQDNTEEIERIKHEIERLSNLTPFL